MVGHGLRGVVLALLVMAGCSAAPEPRLEGARLGPDEPEPADAGSGAPTAERMEIVKGVPNRGRDPAVVAIAMADGGLCTGALISPRLVLTARHCVSRTAESIACPPSGVQVFGDRRPRDLTILLGEDVVSARPVARGLSLVTPSGVTLCEADIAVVVLDKPVVAAKPLPLRPRGPAAGDRVRAVGFGRPGDDDPAGVKLLREHVQVLEVSTAEFRVGEATCQGDSGGPAIDGDTGEIVGVVSRGGPSCEGAGVYNVYTRVDAFAWLMEEAFARVSEVDAEERADAGASGEPKPAKRGTKQKPPSDVGGPCTKADGCAAGICITERSSSSEIVRQYCSRPCGTGDRCPTRYHCKAVAGLEPGSSACVNVR